MLNFKMLGPNQILCQEQDIPLLRINKNSLRLNDVDSKKEVVFELKEKFKNSINLPKIPKGSRSLVYYSLGGNKKYLSLINLSLNSLNTFCLNPNFDVLFICPESWKKDLLNHSFSKKTNFLFHIVEDSNDGVEISKNKCKIFDFVGIDQYKNVLFLDADIIAIKDFSFLLSQDLDVSLLHTKCNENAGVELYNTIYHGLRMLSYSDIVKFEKNKNFPLNAGQFLFVNTPYMRSHFENVIWLMNEWPGYYFFEQAFLCHYFCGFEISSSNILQSKILLASSRNEPQQSLKKLTDDHCLVHFIAPALEPEIKINYIKEKIDKL